MAKRWFRKPVGIYPCGFESRPLRNMFFRKDKKQPESIKGISKQLEKLGLELKDLGKRVSELENKTERIKQIRLVRYDAFSGAGGKQSFSIAILDEDGSGVALTSLYRDDKSRVFAKPIEKGKSEYPLSDEEKKAIKMAFGHHG